MTYSQASVWNAETGAARSAARTDGRGREKAFSGALGGLHAGRDGRLRRSVGYHPPVQRGDRRAEVASDDSDDGPWPGARAAHLVNQVAISADGLALLTAGSNDRSIRLFDLSSGRYGGSAGWPLGNDRGNSVSTRRSVRRQRGDRQYHPGLGTAAGGRTPSSPSRTGTPYSDSRTHQMALSLRARTGAAKSVNQCLRRANRSDVAGKGPEAIRTPDRSSGVQPRRNSVGVRNRGVSGRAGRVQRTVGRARSGTSPTVRKSSRCPLRTSA